MAAKLYIDIMSQPSDIHLAVIQFLNFAATRTLEPSRGPVLMFRLRDVRSSRHSVYQFSIPDGPGLHRRPWRQSLFRASMPENPGYKQNAKSF